jgi:hypothetical protein
MTSSSQKKRGEERGEYALIAPTEAMDRGNELEEREL